MIKLCRAKEKNTGEWVYGYYTLYPKCCGLHPCILTGTESGCIIPKFIDLDTLGSCTDMTDVMIQKCLKEISLKSVVLI